ncbi:MAG: hypothetical protein LUQ57_03115 [Methylococcaceae bacterium]|nr:hypothetical protein [Methylococcaceae bacterium]
MALDPTDKNLFEFLVAEFESNMYGSTSPQTAIAKSIIDRYKADPNTLTKSDVFALDMIILDLQPTERLVQRAVSLRNKYRELAGAKIAATYEPSPLPSPDRFDDPAAKRYLLADLQELQRFIHWSYFFIPIRENIRTWLIRKAIFWMIGYTVLWGFACYWFIYLENPPHYFQAVIATVVYAGLIGGYISSQRRMQMIPTEGDPLSSVYELQNGQYFLWFAPLTGAVFAVVLMLLFISGILQGTIFPAFITLPPESGQNPASCWAFTQLLPKTSADYALLFLWSFIAGFAERFVPDALDRIISRAEDVMKPISKPPGDPKGQAKTEPKPTGAPKDEAKPEQKPQGDQK